jgi:hypothetical protein
VTRYEPPEWATLNAAFFRIRDIVESRELAARDLERDLVSGELPSAVRAFGPDAAEVKTGPLDPEFWRQFVLRPVLWMPQDNRPDPGVKPWLRDADIPPYWEAHFFVQRAALDRLYPSAGTPPTETTAPLAASAASSAPPASEAAADDEEIRKVLRAIVRQASERGKKKPNFKELWALAKDKIKDRGVQVARDTNFKRVAGEPEFKNQRRGRGARFT